MPVAGEQAAEHRSDPGGECNGGSDGSQNASPPFRRNEAGGGQHAESGDAGSAAGLNHPADEQLAVAGGSQANQRAGVEQQQADQDQASHGIAIGELAEGERTECEQGDVAGDDPADLDGVQVVFPGNVGNRDVEHGTVQNGTENRCAEHHHKGCRAGKKRICHSCERRG